MLSFRLWILVAGKKKKTKAKNQHIAHLCQQNGVSIMVQVALGPDASGEKVRLCIASYLQTKLLLFIIKYQNTKMNALVSEDHPWTPFL